MNSTEQIVSDMGEGKPIRVVIEIELAETDAGEVFTGTVTIEASGERQEIGLTQAADYGAAHAAAAAIATTVMNRYGIAGRALGRGGQLTDAESEATR